MGEGVGHHSATLPSAGDWAPSVYPGHSQGGEGCRECAVQRPKYNSPELLLLLPRGSCQPGGAQPRCSGWQPGPSQTSTWSKGLDSRRSLSLAHHQPAQPDDSDAIRFSDRSMPPIVFPSFSSALSFTTVVGHLMGDEVWIRGEQQCGTPLSRLAILSALRGGEVEGGGGCIGWWM